MKKLLLLFAVLLGTVGAWGEGVLTIGEQVSDITTGKYVLYAMCNHGKGLCTYRSDYGGNRLYRIDTDQTIVEGNIVATQYIWDVEVLDGGKITIKWSDDNAKFFPKDNAKNQNFTGNTLAEFILEPHTIDGKDYYALTLEDTNIGYIHANAPGGHPNLSYWNSYDDDGTCVKFQFYSVKCELPGVKMLKGEDMQNGKIYRIQSTTHETFTGINGYTCQMQNQAYNSKNPGQLWKYVVDGNKAYLQNVYAGLYPQNVPSGGSATTTIGAKKTDCAFTYQINGESEDVWNIYFDMQVNIEANGNVNYWYGENAHHYIYEVEITDEALATMCMDWYNANKYTAPEATADTYQKIDIDPNATVIISPSEFAAPSVINEAIDNLAAVEDNLNVTVENVSNIHSLFAALAVYAPAKSALTTYKNAVTSYGELLSIAYTPKAEWGTIIMPINWAKPEGWTRYSCAETEGNVLTLTEFPNGGANKNTPMIIQVAEDKIGTTYQLIGYSKGAGTVNVKSGLLTGVLEDDTMVPAGSYVLARQKSTGKIGFFPVAEDANYGLEKYKCYLTLDPASSRYNALFFDGTETAIESVEGEDENAKAVVYDLAGRRVQNAQKGVFIVNGKVVIK